MWKGGRHVQVDVAETQHADAGHRGHGLPAVRGKGAVPRGRTALVADIATNLQMYAGMRALGLVFGGLLVLAHQTIAEASPVQWPRGALGWVLAFVGYDLLFYWAHRLSHAWDWLFAAHAVHHQGPHMNWSLGLRQSWIHAYLVAPVFWPLAALGASASLVLGVAIVSSLYQLVIHTEGVGRLPWPIELVFNTPAHHRVHHALGHKPSNHGAVLIVWDRLFGTFVDENEPTREYGIPGGYIGPSSLRAQLAPIQRWLGRTVRGTSTVVVRPRLLLGWATVNLALALVVRHALADETLWVRLGAAVLVLGSLALASRGSSRLDCDLRCDS